MATTITVIPNSRTPESVVLYIANPNNAEGAPPLPNISRATFVAAANQVNALLEGPLKELIRRTADLRVLNQTGGNTHMDDVVRFTTIDGGLSTAIQPPSGNCVLNFTHDELECSIFYGGEGAEASQLMVEMRIVHSKDR